MRKGDFLMIEYVGRIASSGEIFDLTDEALAREQGIHNPKQAYGPALVILGSGMTVPGVEKNLLEMKPGEEREFDVKQAEGFGHRDPRLIKVLPYQRFISQKINPVPGIFVNIDGRHAKIQSVSGGRVRVDFNSPLAGKDLHYKLRIVRKLSSPLEKSRALIEHYGIKADVSFKEGSLSIESEPELPEPVKNLLSQQITKWISEVKKIDYPSPGKKAGKSEPGEKPSESSKEGETQ